MIYKIGIFSKLTHIPVSQLRYYDKIGLFRPSYVNRDTGYRYYTADQIPTLNRILILKDLGFPLESIMSLIRGNISNESMLGMLRLLEIQTQQTIEKEQIRLHRIQNQIKVLHQDEMYAIVQKTIPEQLFAGVRVEITPEIYQQNLFNEINTVLIQNKIKPSSPLMGILHSSPHDFSYVEYEFGYILDKPIPNTILPSGFPMMNRNLEAHEVIASITFVGEYAQGRTIYPLLIEWIERNDYSLAGAIRELVLDYDVEKQDIIVEFQAPLQSKETYS